MVDRTRYAGSAQPEDRLIDLLRLKIAGRRTGEVSREIGISQRMLDYLLAKPGQPRFPAGLNVLSVLVDWDDDFEDIALALLHARGRRLRERAHAHAFRMLHLSDSAKGQKR